MENVSLQINKRSRVTATPLNKKKLTDKLYECHKTFELTTSFLANSSKNNSNNS